MTRNAKNPEHLSVVIARAIAQAAEAWEGCECNECKPREVRESHWDTCSCGLPVRYELIANDERGRLWATVKCECSTSANATAKTAER